MKIFLHLLMIAMLSLVNIKPVFSAFLEGLEDVPLADGLKQIENGALSFGNEEIRLVEVFCSAENINFEKIKIVVVFMNKIFITFIITFVLLLSSYSNVEKTKEETNNEDLKTIEEVTSEYDEYVDEVIDLGSKYDQVIFVK